MELNTENGMFIEYCGDGKLTLFDISWEDVLYPHVVRYLTLKDLFNLRCCSRTAREFVNGSLRSMKVLRIIDSNSSSDMGRTIDVITDYCKNLRQIHINNCTWITNRIVETLMNINNLKLLSVDITNCRYLAIGHLLANVNVCQQLKKLVLRDCQGDFNYWQWNDMMKQPCHNIAELDLSELNDTYITERDLINISLKFPNVLRFRLENTDVVTDNVIVAIGKFCTKIEYLNINNCEKVTDRGIR